MPSSHGDPSIDPGGQLMPANDTIDMDGVIYRSVVGDQMDTECRLNTTIERALTT